MPLALFGNVGPWEILLILAVIMLLFGAGKVPAMGRSLGRGLREFKDSVGDTGRELKAAIDETPGQVRAAFGGNISLDERTALPPAAPPAPPPGAAPPPVAAPVADVAEVVESTAEELPADESPPAAAPAPPTGA